MRTFCIVANLGTPVIRTGFMTLDSLLMSVLQRGDVSDILYLRSDGIYSASAAFAATDSKTHAASYVASMMARNRAAPLAEVMASNTRDGDISIGQKRRCDGGNVLSTYTAIATPTLRWYAKGDADSALCALQDIKFIGKKRTSGYGLVHSWFLEESHLDGFIDDKGRPMRPIPIHLWQNEQNALIPVEAAWRGPYWSERNRATCFVPFIGRQA